MWRSFRPIMDMALLSNTNNLRSTYARSLSSRYRTDICHQPTRVIEHIQVYCSYCWSHSWHDSRAWEPIANCQSRTMPTYCVILTWLSSIQLEKARSGARSSDVSSMKEKMQHWRQFNPPINPADRRSMGFHNMSSGSLLCPATKDWKDLGYAPALMFWYRLSCHVSYRTRTGLEDGTIQVAPSDFPVFLWKNEKMNPLDTIDGFLRGEILVKESIFSFYFVIRLSLCRF